MMLKEAIDYANRGWFILPLTPKQKTPHYKLARNGYKSATNDKGIINWWFEQEPNINIGIACDSSGLVILDVDFRNGGTINGLADTYKVSTGNGFHYYYQASQYPNYTPRQGIDVKYRGYVVAPPSIHPNGSIYTYEGGTIQAFPYRATYKSRPAQKSTINISIMEGVLTW